MTFDALLHQPVLLGLGLAAAGVLLWVVFLLPSFIFPASEDPPMETPVPLPPAPSQDVTPILHEKMETVYRPLSGRLAALESRAAPVPTARELQRLYDTMDGLKRNLEDVRGLAGQVAAVAQDRREVTAQVGTLIHQAHGLIRADTAVPPPSVGPDVRRERESFERREAVLREAAAGALTDEAKTLEEVLLEARRARDAALSRRARTTEQLQRRVASWRRAWETRLRVRESSLRAEKEEAERRTAALKARLEEERARRAEESASLSGLREGLSAGRGRLEEALRRREAETSALEGELRSFAEKSDTLRSQIVALERQRNAEEDAASASFARLRSSVREDRDRWRARVKSIAAESAAQRARQEAELKSLQDAASAEAAALEKALSEARAGVESERAVLAAEEDAFAARAARETEEGRRRIEDGRARMEALEKTRGLHAELLRRKGEEGEKELAVLRAWAEGRHRTLQALLAKTASDAAAAIGKVRAEKDALAAKTADEKARCRADLAALEAQAADDRRLLSEARRRAEGEHRERLAALAREESSLAARAADLERETEALKVRAEKLRERGVERIVRRRAAYEKLFAESKQKAESRVTEAESRLSTERMAVRSAETRLAARRKRLEVLRVRRREAAAALLARAKTALESALEAHRRGESAARERLASMKDRAAAWGALKVKWAGAPDRIEESVRISEAGVAQDSARELSRLLAAVDAHGEAFRRETGRNREALERAAARLAEAEGDLSREETSFKEFLDAVEREVVRLDGLRRFFHLVRLPANSAAAEEVA